MLLRWPWMTSPPQPIRESFVLIQKKTKPPVNGWAELSLTWFCSGKRKGSRRPAAENTTLYTICGSPQGEEHSSYIQMQSYIYNLPKKLREQLGRIGSFSCPKDFLLDRCKINLYGHISWGLYFTHLINLPINWVVFSFGGHRHVIATQSGQNELAHTMWSSHVYGQLIVRGI